MGSRSGCLPLTQPDRLLDERYHARYRTPAHSIRRCSIHLSAKVRILSILVGCVEESPEYGLHNAAFLIERGSVRTAHRKIYLPTYGTFEELRYFSPGKCVRAFDSCSAGLACSSVRISGTCRCRISLPRMGRSSLSGWRQALTRLSGDDARIRNAEINTEQHRAYARLLSSYLVFVTGSDLKMASISGADRRIIGPNGETVAQAKLFEEDMIFGGGRE